MRSPIIKIFRWVLLGIIVVVLLVVLLNILYFRIKQSRTINKKPLMIGSNLKRSAESLEIFERRGSQVRFRIRAKHGREMPEISILEGIEASDFNADGSIHYSIQSDFAKYDSARKLVEFSGNVRMFLGKDLELRTGSLHYDLNTTIGSASEMVQWLSHDVSGTAQGIRYYRQKDLLELNKNVQFVLKQKKMPFSASKESEEIHASSDNASCFIAQNRMVFVGKVKIKSNSSGILAGEKIELVWNSDRTNIESLTASGNAECQFKGEKERRILRGDRVVFDIGLTKTLEKISITGQASLNQKTLDQEQTLSAGQIQLNMDPVHNAIAEIHGQSAVKFLSTQGAEEMSVSGEVVDAQFAPENSQLKMVQAHGPARFSMTGRKDTAASELNSDEIRAYFREGKLQASIDHIQAKGSVEWIYTPHKKNRAGRAETSRKLTAATMEIRYSSRGDYPDWGTAEGKVIITENSGNDTVKSPMRKLSADAIKFNFYPERNIIKNMTAAGNVQTTYDKVTLAGVNQKKGSIQTSSDQLNAFFTIKDNAGYLTTAAQWGNFKYQDGSYSISAGRCDYDAEEQSLHLKEAPKISDERSSTTGNQMQYNLKEKMLSIEGKVQTILHSQGNKPSFFQSSTSFPTVIIAETMQYWTEASRFKYTNGKVLAENQQLQAEVLEISGNGEQIEAQGSVYHLLSLKEGVGSIKKSSNKKGPDLSAAPVTGIHSDKLKYLSKNNTINYHGKVIIISKQTTLSADDLDAFFDRDGKNIQHVKATGNVVLRRGNRICRGDSADWHPETSIYEMVGNPVEVEDPEHGRSYPHRLTYFQADDRIVLGK
jgi:LPS export ABC transporter protein LptC